DRERSADRPSAEPESEKSVALARNHRLESMQATHRPGAEPEEQEQHPQTVSKPFERAAWRRVPIETGAVAFLTFVNDRALRLVAKRCCRHDSTPATANRPIRRNASALSPCFEHFEQPLALRLRQRFANLDQLAIVFEHKAVVPADLLEKERLRFGFHYF